MGDRKKELQRRKNSGALAKGFRQLQSLRAPIRTEVAGWRMDGLRPGRIACGIQRRGWEQPRRRWLGWMDWLASADRLQSCVVCWWHGGEMGQTDDIFLSLQIGIIPDHTHVPAGAVPRPDAAGVTRSLSARSRSRSRSPLDRCWRESGGSGSWRKSDSKFPSADSECSRLD